MPNAAALPTEIRLMIYEALFEDATQQYFPHPMLFLSDEISDECAPYLFRHLRLCISNPPQLGLHGDQWVATFSSRNREESSVARAIPWEKIHKAKCLSNWLPHLQQVHIQYIGYQGPKMFLASLEIYFDDQRSSSIEFSANMHPALKTLYLKTLKAVIDNAESYQRHTNVAKSHEHVEQRSGKDVNDRLSKKIERRGENNANDVFLSINLFALLTMDLGAASPLSDEEMLSGHQLDDDVEMAPAPSLPPSPRGNKNGENNKRKAEIPIDGPPKKLKISRRTLYNRLKAESQWEPSHALQARLNLFMRRPPQPRYDTAVVAYAQHYRFISIEDFLYIGDIMTGSGFPIHIWYRPDWYGKGQLYPEPSTGVRPISMLRLTDIDLYDDALAAMFGAERLKNMRAEALNGYIKDIWHYAAAFPGVRARFTTNSDPPVPLGNLGPQDFKCPSWALSRII
ncbi:hypothetical protein KCU65_g2728, partial [Aureobasidium melanogenum]